jgi:predicted nucleic acid-binding protein
VICECVLAEIRPAFARGEVERFLEDWALELVASTRQSALLAGEMFGLYLSRRRSSPNRVLPDFLVGAHATVLTDRLLARDRGYYRDYFRRLALLSP